ncbi:MAG: hypothetical protein WC670_00740 [Pseudolabrys sp.]
MIKSDLRSTRQQCQFVPATVPWTVFAIGMLALFTSSWRRKAAIVALVFYAMGIAAPAAAFALAAADPHCPTISEVRQIAGSHHASGHHADSQHSERDAASPNQPAADHPGIASKCCGTFCFTGLAPAHVAIVEPASHVSEVIQPLAVYLLGHGSSPIDRPPRNLTPL